MGKKIIIIFSFFLVFILLNIFSRFLYDQSWFGNISFAKEIDPFDIITLIITTIATIWFGLYVSKKLTEQRYQKEFVINDLKQIEQDINFIERSFQSPIIDLQSHLNVLNKLKTNIERFSKTVEIFEISNINIKELKKIYNQLYANSTNTGGNELIMDEVSRIEISQVCTELICISRKFIFKINKC